MDRAKRPFTKSPSRDCLTVDDSCLEVSPLLPPPLPPASKVHVTRKISAPGRAPETERLQEYAKPIYIYNYK